MNQGSAAPPKEEMENVRRRSQGFWRIVWRRYKRSLTGVSGLFLVLLLIVIGFLAPALANEQPLLCRYKDQIYAPALKELLWTIPGGKRLFNKKKPFNLVTFNFKKRFNPERGDWAISTPIGHGPLRTSSAILEQPSRKHLLGTDEIGRDILARMIHGARVSMLVGFVSVGISTLIGLLLGALAGYFGSWVDIVVSRAIEVVLCFPVFFLVLTIVAWLEPSIWNVMIALGAVRWTGTARYVRGEFIRLREVEYSLAARALGARPARIIIRHILPNSLAPIFVTVTFGIAGAILIEAGLSWLGLGVMPPAPSWGNILRTAFDNMFTSSHMIYPPCIAIFVAVLSYNLVGDSLRDAIDPRLAQNT